MIWHGCRCSVIVVIWEVVSIEKELDVSWVSGELCWGEILWIIDWKVMWEGMILIIMDEILKGICEHCMTLNFVYHRAMITVDRPIDSYLYWGSFSDWLDGDHRSTYWEKWPTVVLALKSPTAPTVVWQWRDQPFPFCNGKQNWGSLSGDCQRGKLFPHYGEEHSVKSYSEE